MTPGQLIPSVGAPTPLSAGLPARLSQLFPTKEAVKEGADLLNRTTAGLKHWIKGDREPNLSTLEEIATLKGVSPAWLAFGIEEGETSISDDERAVLSHFQRLSPEQRAAALTLLQESVIPLKGTAQGT